MIPLWRWVGRIAACWGLLLALSAALIQASPRPAWGELPLEKAIHPLNPPRQDEFLQRTYQGYLANPQDFRVEKSDGCSFYPTITGQDVLIVIHAADGYALGQLARRLGRLDTLLERPRHAASDLTLQFPLRFLYVLEGWPSVAFYHTPLDSFLCG